SKPMKTNTDDQHLFPPYIHFLEKIPSPGQLQHGNIILYSFLVTTMVDISKFTDIWWRDFLLFCIFHQLISFFIGF
ncbi:hypothetical protein S245_010600, partial [Arachis hypogaea]